LFPVNWSAVATEDFRSTLLELDSQREAATMNEVIDRLRAAEKLERDREYQDGHEVGEAWPDSVAV
jgi:hypothetical protein